MVIFYLDDDLDDREMFCDAVKVVDQTISCVPFDSGQQLLEHFLSSSLIPSYIFIDINMPKMNGYECVDELKLNPALTEVPIVMYSTAFNPTDVVTYSNLGLKFLTKPTDFSILVHSIKELLQLNYGPAVPR